MKKCMDNVKSFIFLIVLMCSVVEFTYANTIDHYLQEARAKAAEDNLVEAAVLYQRVIKLDSNHSLARKELTEVLMKAKLKDPESDHTEAELAVMEEIARAQKN